VVSIWSWRRGLGRVISGMLLRQGTLSLLRSWSHLGLRTSPEQVTGTPSLLGLHRDMSKLSHLVSNLFNYLFLIITL
jgi:hypothetical protein